MNEKCGVCERPRGDLHRYPVAGECTAPDSTDYTVSLQCLSIALRKAQDDVKAAEERGRRRGLKERDELRAVRSRITEYLSLGGLFNPEMMDHGAVSRLLQDAGIAIDAALAPRDSAPGCICQGGKTQPYCAYCLGMSVPRDSGKVET